MRAENISALIYKTKYKLWCWLNLRVALSGNDLAASKKTATKTTAPSPSAPLTPAPPPQLPINKTFTFQDESLAAP
jgi:hypothetical protein